MVSLDNVKYITDSNGNKTSVILDYEAYEHFLEIIEDMALAKAMEEAENSETIDTEEFMNFLERKISES